MRGCLTYHSRTHWGAKYSAPPQHSLVPQLPSNRCLSRLLHVSSRDLCSHSIVIAHTYSMSDTLWDMSTQVHIHSSAVITRSNLWRYYIRHSESESDIRITTDTPYLAREGKLWGVSCEDLGENSPRYNGTSLHCALVTVINWSTW